MCVLEQIQKDMFAAMIAVEKEKAGTLRTTLAKLKDKRIEKREALSESEEIQVLRILVKQRRESVEMFEKGGREELASAEKAEIKILDSYLPQMMPEAEIRNIVKTVVEEVGATSMADMGKIMPEVMKRGKGLIDGKTAQQFVRELFG